MTSITDINQHDLDYAIRLQEIRSDFEHFRDKDMLWIDLSEVGFDSHEISRCVTHPARITGCSYYGAARHPA
jgi:hypothetical protein